MLERVAAVPGVASAGTTQTTFMPNESMQTGLYVEGRPIDIAASDTANIRHITPGYFTTLRVRIVDGRPIDDRDQLGTTPVCVVSDDFARQFWPHQRAIGHRVRRNGPTAPWMTVVGVAGDVMDAGAGVKAGPTLYIPYLQNNTATARVTLVVATRGDPLASAGVVQRAIWSVDPNQAATRVGRLEDLLVTSASDQRFRTVLLTIFAASGMLLALVGVYGVAAAAVSARRWEAAGTAGARRTTWRAGRENGSRHHRCGGRGRPRRGAAVRRFRPHPPAAALRNERRRYPDNRRCCRRDERRRGRRGVASGAAHCDGVADDRDEGDLEAVGDYLSLTSLSTRCPVTVSPTWPVTVSPT